MTFTNAVLISIFFLIVAAILGGLIIYFMLRSRLKVLSNELKKLQKDYDKLKASLEAKEKEMKLEVMARDKKMGYLQEKIDKADAICEEKQNTLQLQLASKNDELLDLHHKLKEIELNNTAILPPKQEHNAEVADLIEQIKSKDEHIAVLTQRIADLETRLNSTVHEASNVPDGDKRAQALAKIREKAKSFDYSNIGIVAESEKDDLKLIVGIGPFIEEKLHALGIFTFAQIARFNEQDIKQVTEAIEFFPGRIERDEWIRQAKEFVEKKQNEIKE